MNWARLACGATVSAAVAILATGCTQAVAGTASSRADQASEPVPASDIGDIVVDTDQINDIVGVDLEEAINVDEPASQSGFGECEQLQARGLGAYLGGDWEEFRYITLSNGEASEGPYHFVAQSVAVYPDAEAARAAYDDATDDNLDCDGHALSTENADWSQTVSDDPADGTAIWETEQTNSADQWVCSGQAQVRNNVLLRVIVCGSDDEVTTLSAETINAMAATVWEHSAPS